MATAALAHQEPTARDRLREIIAEKSLRKGAFKLSSGKMSDYFFDMKPTMLDPEGANLIANEMLPLIQSERADAVGGLVLSAVPIVSVVCANSFHTRKPIPAFFVRKEPKGHGTNQLIDGNLQPGWHVVLVDDVTTTGGSVLKAVDAVRLANCRVDRVVTVVDRLEGAADRLRGEGITLTPLFTRDAF